MKNSSYHVNVFGWCLFLYPTLQVPVSIADLGGTEIDLRFANPKEGRLFVIVAPVRRFSDGEFPEIHVKHINVALLLHIKAIVT